MRAGKGRAFFGKVEEAGTSRSRGRWIVAVCKRLQEYLDTHSVRYQLITHPEAFTSQEVAAASHISGRDIAKVVLVKRGGQLAMVVLPAACKVGVDRLARLIGSPQVALAREEDFEGLFTDCDTGAMPPFGNLYGLEVYVDDELASREHLIFQAGNHRELVSIPYRDYERLVQPKVTELCSHA
jgi:Ala-tRNA(Pro) deacylase